MKTIRRISSALLAMTLAAAMLVVGMPVSAAEVAKADDPAVTAVTTAAPAVGTPGSLTKSAKSIVKSTKSICKKVDQNLKKMRHASKKINGIKFTLYASGKVLRKMVASGTTTKAAGTVKFKYSYYYSTKGELLYLKSYEKSSDTEAASMAYIYYKDGLIVRAEGLGIGAYFNDGLYPEQTNYIIVDMTKLGEIGKWYEGSRWKTITANKDLSKYALTGYFYSISAKADGNNISLTAAFHVLGSESGTYVIDDKTTLGTDIQQEKTYTSGMTALAWAKEYYKYVLGGQASQYPYATSMDSLKVVCTGSHVDQILGVYASD